MNLGLLDWLIVAAVMAIMLAGVGLGRRQMRSVADFLAANRSAGRYILTVSQGLSGLGAITIVGLFEMNYVAGLPMTWWGFTMSLVVLAITVSGWVVYRFRETRALTLAEFFERRYSRSFRVFAGLLAFLSGIVNFGIFPAVGARFFLHYCGISETIPLLGANIPTFPLLMLALLGTALFFVFAGGQITVIITDFLQGLIVGSAFIVLVLFLFQRIDWSQIVTALGTAPENASLINPFKTSQVDDFNLWYFLIGVVGVIYGTMSWQGTQGYNASARTAHEAKMGAALSNWRGVPQNLFLLFVPVVAYTVLHHPDFTATAATVNNALESLGSETSQSQLRTPLVLARLLPPGLLGLFAAVMLAAFLTTHDTYLHSWGSILVQDVVLPFRRRPLGAREHLLALRLAIGAVAVFIFFFSLLFQQSQYIFLFFAITGAIFAGGSGAVIIGGLYWKRGTTPAAWAAMITGSSIAVSGIIIHQIDRDFFINGQVFWAIAMGASSLVYVLVSLLGPRRDSDLDHLLHRGRHLVAEDHGTDRSALPESDSAPSKVPRQHRQVPLRGLGTLGLGPEFTRGDRFIYLGTYAWTALWVITFAVGTVYNLTRPVPDDRWASFWKTYIFVQIAAAIGVVIWFAVGGFRDLRTMLRRLSELNRDAQDDGVVRSEQASGDPGRESARRSPTVAEDER